MILYDRHTQPSIQNGTLSVHQKDIKNRRLSLLCIKSHVLSLQNYHLSLCTIHLNATGGIFYTQHLLFHPLKGLTKYCILYNTPCGNRLKLFIIIQSKICSKNQLFA